MIDDLITSGRTLVYPMIGHPVAQVKSPATFNRYFREKRIDAVMVTIDVHPADVGHFFALLRGWQNCPGCIVTIPHKQEAARQADDLSPTARDLAAVNVIRRTGHGRLAGDIVDGLGFLEALRTHGFDPRGKSAAVFGAGGAGGAIGLRDSGGRGGKPHSGRCRQSEAGPPDCAHCVALSVRRALGWAFTPGRHRPGRKRDAAGHERRYTHAVPY